MIKKKTLSGLTKDLDYWFQRFVRLRDSDPNGYCRCISCGKIVRYGSGQLHAGHYYNRAHKSLRWDEQNVNGQCCHCNTFLEGNIQGYTKGLIKKYGAEVLQEMEINKQRTVKYTSFELNLLIGQYKTKCKELEKNKRI